MAHSIVLRPPTKLTIKTIKNYEELTLPQNLAFKFVANGKLTNVSILGYVSCLFECIALSVRRVLYFHINDNGSLII